MVDWKEIIREKKPDASKTTIKVYNSTVTNLIKHLEVENAKPDFFDTHSTVVLKYLKEIQPSKRKSIIASILAVTSDKEVKEKYRKQMIEDIYDYYKEEQKQELTQKQKENWMSQEDILKLYNSLEKEIKPLWTKENLKKRDLKDIMKYVLLSCFVLIPPRRILDYSMFKLRNVDPKTSNYMNGKKFIFNTYKTAKTYGKQTVAIPPKLNSIIVRWKKLHENDYLLFGGTGKPMSQPQVTNLLKSIFPKKLSVNMLRHIYISEKVLKDTPALAELDKVAQEMGNSTGQQQLYRKISK